MRAYFFVFLVAMSGLSLSPLAQAESEADDCQCELSSSGLPKFLSDEALQAFLPGANDRDGHRYAPAEVYDTIRNHLAALDLEGWVEKLGRFRLSYTEALRSSNGRLEPLGDVLRLDFDSQEAGQSGYVFDPHEAQLVFKTQTERRSSINELRCPNSQWCRHWFVEEGYGAHTAVSIVVSNDTTEGISLGFFNHSDDFETIGLPELRSLDTVAKSPRALGDGIEWQNQDGKTYLTYFPPSLGFRDNKGKRRYRLSKIEIPLSDGIRLEGEISDRIRAKLKMGKLGATLDYRPTESNEVTLKFRRSFDAVLPDIPGRMRDVFRRKSPRD